MSEAGMPPYPSQRGDLDGAGVGEEVQVGVLGYPEVVQDAKACYHTMGSLSRVMRRIFWIS
jgi:hypothetical protein